MSDINQKKKDLEKKDKIDDLSLKKSDDKKKETEGSSVYRNFEIKLKNSEIEKEFDVFVKKYSGELKLSGFRKGKIPTEVVKSKYGEGIMDEVIEKLIEKQTLEIIKNEKLSVVSNPVVEKIDHKKGSDLKAKVKVELMPEIVLPELETIEVEVKKDDLKEEKYDEKKQIDYLLESNKKRVPAGEREIKKGDQVDLIIQSQYSDTKRFMPKSESTYNVEENAEFEIDDFYKEIIGKKSGDDFEVTRSYGKDTKKKSWAGKKIKHYVKIKRVFEFIKPLLNEEFLKTAGFKDEQSFKDELKRRFDDHSKHLKEEKIYNELKIQISEKIGFEIPESMIINEINRTASQYSELIMSLPEEKRKDYLESLRGGAEKSLKFSLILDEIAKKYKIKVEDNEIEDEFKTISEHNNIDIKEIKKYYNSKEHKENLKINIASRKSLELLKEKVNIKEV